MADAVPFHYGRHKNVQKEPIPFQANALGITASGSAVVTFDYPKSNVGIAIHQLVWSFHATPTTPSITIQDTDGTIVWGPFDVTVAVGHQSLMFDPPLLFTQADADADANLVITVAGGAILTTLYVTAAIDGTELV